MLARPFSVAAVFSMLCVGAQTCCAQSRRAGILDGLFGRGRARSVLAQTRIEQARLLPRATEGTRAGRALGAASLRPYLAALLVTFPLTLAALDSEPAPLAGHSLLLDIARAGSRLVAVGDRGHVLLSDDEGRNWRQVIVPTRAMLTGISFGDAQHGLGRWATTESILATVDGGATWTHQDTGQDLETIFLDIFFSDAQHGLAVGAYGKCMLTMDGGKSWQPAAPVPDEAHLNSITPTATDTVYLAGESGLLLTSDDARRGWRRIEVPYEGSLLRDAGPQRARLARVWPARPCFCLQRRRLGGNGIFPFLCSSWPARN